MKMIRIAIIDSGIDVSQKGQAYKVDVLGNLDNYDDIIGHGSIIFQLIKKYSDKSKIQSYQDNR